MRHRQVYSYSSKQGEVARLQVQRSLLRWHAVFYRREVQQANSLRHFFSTQLQDYMNERIGLEITTTRFEKTITFQLAWSRFETSDYSDEITHTRILKTHLKCPGALWEKKEYVWHITKHMTATVLFLVCGQYVNKATCLRYTFL